MHSNLSGDPDLKLRSLLKAMEVFQSCVGKGDEVITSLMKIVSVSEKITVLLSNNPELHSAHAESLTLVFGTKFQERSPIDLAFDRLKIEALKNTTR